MSSRQEDPGNDWARDIAGGEFLAGAPPRLLKTLKPRDEEGIRVKKRF